MLALEVMAGRGGVPALGRDIAEAHHALLKHASKASNSASVRRVKSKVGAAARSNLSILFCKFMAS